MTHRAAPPIALTIAGSDSGGGAGIQADLKTFHALGVHGLSVITAVTSQNTRGVSAVHPIPREHVHSQLASVFDDFAIAAVKTGMLASAALTLQVAAAMRERRPAWLVVDPVMIATSGARLLDESAIGAIIGELIPLASILTPNLPEAEALIGRPIVSEADVHHAGEVLLSMGARGVLLKGGHGAGAQVIDRYYDGEGVLEIANERLPIEGHGTGCTLASAIAAGLALGKEPRAAVSSAVTYVHQALARGYEPGRGGLTVLGH